MSRKWQLFTLVFVLSLIACGGDEASPPADTPTTAPTNTAEVLPPPPRSRSQIRFWDWPMAGRRLSRGMRPAALMIQSLPFGSGQVQLTNYWSISREAVAAGVATPVNGEPVFTMTRWATMMPPTGVAVCLILITMPIHLPTIIWFMCPPVRGISILAITSRNMRRVMGIPSKSTIMVLTTSMPR